MKITRILLLLILVLGTKCAAQYANPRGIHYQAVVRDNSGNLIPNSGVNFRFSVNSVAWYGGFIVHYIETHVGTTNSLGLVNLIIGNGTPMSPYSSWDFENNIPWSDNTLTLTVEIDPTGSGSSYSLISNAPFRAVPFAYFAEKALNANQANSADFATEALHATNAENAVNALSSGHANYADLAITANTANIAISLNNPYTNFAQFTNTDNLFNGTFSGNGSGLTNLNADQITSGILTSTKGGTGVNPATCIPGTILVSSGSGTWSALAPGTPGQVLKMVGGMPTWANESTSGQLVSSNVAIGTVTIPSSTSAFISPVCSLTVSSPLQKIHVLATALLGSTSSSGGLYINVVIKNLSTGAEVSSTGINNIYSGQSEKNQYTLPFFVDGYTLGTGNFVIGIKGQMLSSSYGSFNNNGPATVHVTVFD